jgi:hypothetical protein
MHFVQAGVRNGEDAEPDVDARILAWKVVSF